MIRTRQGNKSIETDGYRRKRRWAILLLCLCSALLAVGWSYDYFLAPYDRVVAVSAGSQLVVLAQPRNLSREDEVTYERRRKPEGKDWEEPERLYGSFLTATALGGDVLVLHEESATRVSEGKPIRAMALDAKFFPDAAAPSPTAPEEAWVFGIRGTRKVACARVVEGAWTDLDPPLETRAAKSGVKAAAAPWGAWVVWREPSEPSGPCLRVARREAGHWIPFSDRIEYIHGDALYSLCSAGEEAWLVYAAKRLEAKGELCFLARRLTKEAIGAEEAISISDPLRVKREVLSIAVARFEGSMWLFAGRLGGVHVSRMKAELERGMYPMLSDPGGRLSQVRSLAWTWIGALMTVAALLTGTGLALLREKRYVDGTAEEPSATPLPSATLTQRGVAFSVDFLLLAPFGFVFQAFVFQDVRTVADPSRPEYYITSGFLLSILLFHVLAVVYYTLSEANFGQSVGKWVVGIEVQDLSGKRITLRQAAIRNALRLVDAGYVFQYFVGMFSILVTARAQRVGDLAAGTIVVQRPVPEAEEETEDEQREDSE